MPLDSSSVEFEITAREVRKVTNLLNCPRILFPLYIVFWDNNLGDFAHNVGQRIILNHAIVYDETVRSGVHRHILLALKFQSHIHMRSWLIRFVEHNR